MEVLVTGGAGFIGSFLADELIKRGHRVRAFDNLDTQVHGADRQLPEYLNAEVRLIRGDVRDPDAWCQAVDGVDVVFHLAAAVGVGQSMYEIPRYIDSNVAGTGLLLQHIADLPRARRPSKLVIASSMSVYGEGMYRCAACGMVEIQERCLSSGWEPRCQSCGASLVAVPSPESKLPNPSSVYAVTKLTQEQLCLSFGKAYKVSTVALRYFNVYGPRQALFNPYTGVIAIFCSRLLNDKPPLIYEDGLQTRDFVHVQDIIQANLKVMESEEANYRVFNVGTGRAVSIKEMSDILRRLMGKEDIQPHITGVYRKGDIRHCIADITLLREVVGYKPTVQVEEGLKDVVAWSRGQLAEDRLDVAVQALEERCLQQCDVIPGGLPNVSQ